MACKGLARVPYLPGGSRYEQDFTVSMATVKRKKRLSNSLRSDYQTSQEEF